MKNQNLVKNLNCQLIYIFIMINLIAAILDTTTNKDYYESYVDYYLLKISIMSLIEIIKIISFFEDSLIKNFNKFNNLIDQDNHLS